jgi:hypothetical protein
MTWTYLPQHYKTVTSEVKIKRSQPIPRSPYLWRITSRCVAFRMGFIFAKLAILDATLLAEMTDEADFVWFHSLLWIEASPASGDLPVYLSGGDRLLRPDPLGGPLDGGRAAQLPFVVAQDGLQGRSKAARQITRPRRERHLHRRGTGIDIGNSVQVYSNGRQPST